MKIFFGFLILALLALSCTDDETGSVNSINGAWKLTSFRDLTTGIVTVKTDQNSWGKDVVIRFDDTQNPRKFSGILTTNDMSGQFDYIAPSHFQITSFSQTKVGQPEWANRFYEGIMSADINYSIKHGELVITYAGNTKRMILIRQ